MYLRVNADALGSLFHAQYIYIRFKYVHVYIYTPPPFHSHIIQTPNAVIAPMSAHSICHHYHRPRRTPQCRRRSYLLTSRFTLPLAFFVGVPQLFTVASWNLLGLPKLLCVSITLRCSLSDIPSFISNKLLKC